MSERDETEDILSSVLKLVARDRLPEAAPGAAALLLGPAQRVDAPPVQADTPSRATLPEPDAPPPLTMGDDARVIGPAETGPPEGYAEDADYEFFSGSWSGAWDRASGPDAPVEADRLRAAVAQVLREALDSEHDELGHALRRLVRTELRRMLGGEEAE